MKIMYKFDICLIATVIALCTSVTLAAGPATLRGGQDITTQLGAPAMPKVEDIGQRRVRNYPEQPPTIPHDISDYEVTAKANQCLSCHSRTRTGESQAPMVSVTHFMDRDMQVLATVSPRRYFCNQCHVQQLATKPLVESTFQDVEELLNEGSGAND